MEDGKLEFMKITKFNVSFKQGTKNWQKTSLEEMLEYHKKGVNRRFCALHLKCQSLEDPEDVRECIIIQVPTSMKEPEYDSSVVKFDLRNLKKYEPTSWFMFSPTDQYETPGDEWSTWRYWLGHEDLWEIIADIDDYAFGDESPLYRISIKE
jgi:hypothetical protein